MLTAAELQIRTNGVAILGYGRRSGRTEQEYFLLRAGIFLAPCGLGRCSVRSGAMLRAEWGYATCGMERCYVQQ